MGYYLTGQYLAWTTPRPDATCWWCQYSIQTREHLFKNCLQWHCLQKTLWVTVLKQTNKLPGPIRHRGRTSIAELLADERCSQTVFQFLATTDLGQTSGPPAVEDNENAVSEASEWEAREQEEWVWERREEEEGGGGSDEAGGGFCVFPFLLLSTFIKFPSSFLCLHNHWCERG